MTEAQEKEFNELAERFSDAHDKMMAALIVPPLLAASVGVFASKIEGGMQKAQAFDELLGDVLALSDQYPSMREGLAGITEDIRKHRNGAMS